MYFTITTNKEVAEAIKKTFEFEEKIGNYRSCKLGEIYHYKGFSTVQIKSRNGLYIEPADIFFIGLFSAKQ